MIIWCLATYKWGVRKVVFPSPTNLVQAFKQMAPQLPTAILASLRITMIGFFIGVAAGLLMGMAMGYSRGFLKTVGPFMEATRPIPVFAFIPLFMLWFGIGMLPQILLIALGTMAIIGVQTYEAILNIPVVYVRAGFNLGADKKHVFRTVVLPYIVPHLIGAIRVAAANAWGLDVAAEMMGVQTGLGHIMVIQQNYLNTPQIIVVVIIYAVMAILFDKLIQFVQRKLTYWTDRANLTFEGLTAQKTDE